MYKREIILIKDNTIRLASNSHKKALKSGLMLSIMSDQTNLNDIMYALSVKAMKKPRNKIYTFSSFYVESFSFKHGTNFSFQMFKVIWENMPNVCQE